MPRPHTATGWWGTLINAKAGGRQDFLAKLLGVSDRTVRRWRSGEMQPKTVRLEKLRILAGKKMIARSDAPEFMNASVDPHN